MFSKSFTAKKQSSAEQEKKIEMVEIDMETENLMRTSHTETENLALEKDLVLVKGRPMETENHMEISQHMETKDQLANHTETESLMPIDQERQAPDEVMLRDRSIQAREQDLSGNI